MGKITKFEKDGGTASVWKRGNAPPFVPSIAGQRISKVRSMSKAELYAEGWDSADTVPVALLYASQDEEGNGPGALFRTRSLSK